MFGVIDLFGRQQEFGMGRMSGLGAGFTFGFLLFDRLEGLQFVNDRLLFPDDLFQLRDAAFEFVTGDAGRGAHEEYDSTNGIGQLRQNFSDERLRKMFLNHAGQRKADPEQ